MQGSVHIFDMFKREKIEMQKMKYFFGISVFRGRSKILFTFFVIYVVYLLSIRLLSKIIGKGFPVLEAIETISNRSN